MHFIIFFSYLLILHFMGSLKNCIATDVNPNFNIIQKASDDSLTLSVTFLSSGYLLEDSDRFKKDVMNCINALYNKSENVVADPWGRYADLFNIYSIFQPSNESGASRIVGTNHNCSKMKNCGPKNVNNNLGCSFGTPDPSVISCDPNLIYKLVNTPDNLNNKNPDLIVVLVNEPNEVSSTGGKSLAIFTNEPSFMPFFIIRELSKAIAYLAGEFSRGINEFKDVYIPNCAKDISEAQKSWRYWIDKGLIDETPKQGCFFNNYYRPTNEGCMMRNSSINTMCPICKENVNLAIISRSNKKSNQFLTSSRCPKEGYTIHVDILKDLQLSVRNITMQEGIKITWSQENGSIINNSNNNNNGIIIIPSNTLALWQFPKKLIATIEDNSPNVRPDKRTEGFKSTTTFLLISNKSNICEDSKCGLFSICTSCTESNCTSKRDLTNNNIESSSNLISTKKTNNDIIAVSVCVVIAILVITILLFIYCCCYYSRPHEVLSTVFMDYLICWATAIVSILILGLSILILVWVIQDAEIHALLWRQLLIPSIVIGVIIYIITLCNLGAVLFRFYLLAIICGIISFIIGLFLIGFGVFLGWIYVNHDLDALIGYVASRWIDTVQYSPDIIRNIQSNLFCSGFFANCLEVNASYCPINSISNIYVNPCENPFMDSITGNYIPASAATLITGLLLIGLAVLNIIFVMRFCYLSKVGKKRRAYRNDSGAPILPFTFSEAKEVRRIFYKVADKPFMTLQGNNASQFLQKIFNTTLDSECENNINCREEISYDELMSIYFPYFKTSNMDPRQLTPDEAYAAQGVVNLQRSQYQKLDLFATASGALSPEAIYNLYHHHALNRFLLNQEEYIALLEEAAKDCPDIPMCEGLSPFEIEGLRHAWVTLNPRVIGSLSDTQIDRFYQWTHGRPLCNYNAFKEWKNSLDVRQTGVIGWGEFCYPFAQRSQLRRARAYLTSNAKEIPPEILTRRFVEDNFGREVTLGVFMKYENEIPIERLVEYLMRHGEKEGKNKNKGKRKKKE